MRAAVSKLLFPNISTSIVSQKIFRGLDELLPSLIFWVGENLLFFFFCFFAPRSFSFPASGPMTPMTVRPRWLRLIRSQDVSGSVRPKSHSQNLLDLTSCLFLHTWIRMASLKLDPKPQAVTPGLGPDLGSETCLHSPVSQYQETLFMQVKTAVVAELSRMFTGLHHHFKAMQSSRR